MRQEMKEKSPIKIVRYALKNMEEKMKRFMILVFIVLIGLPLVFASPPDRLESFTGSFSGCTVTSPQYIIVDDYAGFSNFGKDWYYTRIGTNRGKMGPNNGIYSVNIGGGNASVNVTLGWAGVWTSLLDLANWDTEIVPTQLLGPYIKSQYQPSIIGVEVDIIDGTGQFKIELKKKDDTIIAQQVYQLTGGPRTLVLSITPQTSFKFLNWVVDGPGNAIVDQVRLEIESPGYTFPEAVFLFSYGHLSQCYQPDSGLVRDRARWPAQDRASIQTIGTFALATAIAWQLEYVEESVAVSIITKTRDTLLTLQPCYKGLFPHFLKNGDIEEGSEWSSIDTVITLTAEILACQAIGEDTSPLEAMLQAIDWNDLTDNGTRSIGMGYDDDYIKLESRWDTFGAEAFLVAIAYCAATGDNNVILENFDYPPTWDGSGFNDELAALFFPMNTTDMWGNDWWTYRQEAFANQVEYIVNLQSIHQDYHNYDLLGLSASEVPEPWTVPGGDEYGAWGVGGHNGQANDGTALVGYPIIAPHYAAMVWPEHPDESATVFQYLMEVQKRFTPLNNVESFGIDLDGDIHWNSLKGSWNLSLQALAASRALFNGNYLPYDALSQNDFLYQAFGEIADQSVTLTSPNGNESWHQGASQPITWMAKGLSGEVTIDLYRNGSFLLNIGTTTVDSGSLDWNIPFDLYVSDDYQVRIFQGTTEDYSDNNFSVVSQVSFWGFPDFNQDGQGDVIWRYDAPGGYNAVWLLGTVGGADTAAVHYPNKTILTDLLANQNMSSAMISSLSDPRDDPQAVELLPVADQNWKLAGTGDFNRDGKIDIVWSNVDTAHNCVWYMDGTAFADYGRLPDGSTTDWVLGGVGDFDRDGQPDLIWHNEVDGRNGVWYLAGVQLKGIDIMTTGANVNWKLCGTGDFNNDGQVDLVWRNTNDGRNAVWYMDGVELSSVGWLDTVANLDWKLRGTGDFDGNGKTDLIWTNISDDRNCIWHLDGVTLIGVEFLTTVTDTDWRIVN